MAIPSEERLDCRPLLGFLWRKPRVNSLPYISNIFLPFRLVPRRKSAATKPLPVVAGQDALPHRPRFSDVVQATNDGLNTVRLSPRIGCTSRISPPARINRTIGALKRHGCALPVIRSMPLTQPSQASQHASFSYRRTMHL